MGPSDILTCVFPLYGTVGHFNMRFSLIWDRRTFYHAFFPYMEPSDILTCVFPLYGTVGHYNMRFSLIWDRPTF